MFLRVYLSSLYGAEYINHNGIDGIFVPTVNGTVKASGRRTKFHIGIRVYESPKEPGFMVGFLNVPEENRDLILSSDKLTKLNSPIVYINNRPYNKKEQEQRGKQFDDLIG